MMDRTNPAGQEASLLKEFTIGKNDAGQRLDRWLAKTLPCSPPLWPKSISASSG